MAEAQQLTLGIETPKSDLIAPERFLIYQAFVSGPSRPPLPNFFEGYLRNLVTRGLITLLPDDEYKLTLAGVEDFTQRYLREVAEDIRTEETTINYFRCNFVEHDGDSYDGVPIVASNEAALNYVKMKMAVQQLGISDKTCAHDYVVLDFIDVFTGESHDLFPGDTVVMNGDGYVIHKFSE